MTEANGTEEQRFDEETWPRDPQAPHRFLCTPTQPMPRGASMTLAGIRRQWTHTGTVSDGECFEGCCDDYKCVDCGMTWRVECAQ